MQVERLCYQHIPRLNFRSAFVNESLDKAFHAGIPIAVAAGKCNMSAKGDNGKAQGSLCMLRNTICVCITSRSYKIKYPM